VAVYGNNSAKIYLYVNQSDGNNSGVIDVLGLSSSSIVALSTRSSSGSGANQGVVSVKDNGTSKIVLDSGGDSYFNVGNLGIGSTGPSQKLDVVGSAKFTGNIGVGSAPSTYGLKVQNDNGIEFYNTAGTSIGSLQREGSSGGYEDQGYLTIKKGGLATAIIGSTIGLFNGFYGGSESVFRVQIAGSSSPYNRQGALALYSAGTQTISLYSAGDSYVNTGGNFGVGSTAPREKLEVDGTIRATGYKSSDGTAGVTVTTCTGFKNGLCISGT
jgi:hypothetical protein